MCGILLCVDTENTRVPRERGPDESSQVSVYVGGGPNAVHYKLSFERLQVYGEGGGKQPFLMRGVHNTLVSATNGEIYNHALLRETAFDCLLGPEQNAAGVDPHMLMGVQGGAARSAVLSQCLEKMGAPLAEPADPGPAGDCDVVPKLFLAYGVKGFDKIHGVFASVLLYGDYVILARDYYGVRPLYYGRDRNDRLVAASTAECFEDGGAVANLRQFPPGKVLVHDAVRNLEWYFDIDPECSVPIIPNEPFTPAQTAATAFMEACRIRCTQQEDVSGRKMLVLLSGGMDSSCVLAAACHFCSSENIVAVTGYHKESGDTQDLVHSRELCKELGVEHLIVPFPNSTDSAVRAVVRRIGSWDTTTVRASIAQFEILVAARAKYPDAKVVLCGEGADEVGFGYQNFKVAPSPEAAQAESERLLAQIHQYDGLRVDRSTASFGLEVRLPFLDVPFVQAFHEIPAETRHSAEIEKAELRRLMATEVTEFIPTFRCDAMRKILKRSKQALSDSVGSGHVRALQALADRHVPDRWLEEAAYMWPHCTPKTKEQCYYRSVFNDVLPGHSDAQIDAYWQFAFVGAHTDPSATLQDFFTES